MFDPKLLKLLICPRTKQELIEAPSELIDRLNGAIAEARLQNEAGKKVDKPLEAGLVSQNQEWFYPVIDGIPVMLADEAIRLDQLDAA